jgi:hypothetical protein
MSTFIPLTIHDVHGGPTLDYALQAVIAGVQPLRLALWQDTARYLTRVKAEREWARKPLRFQLGAGGIRIGWRTAAG